MAGYPGATVVTGTISLSSSTDTYATHWDILGKGGAQPAADIAARNAITTARRSWGMFCTVYADGTSANNKTYQLQNVALGGVDNDITNNNNWKVFSSGSGSGTVSVENNGTPVIARSVLNIKNGITAVDDSLNSKTIIKIGGALTEDSVFSGAYIVNFANTGVLIGSGSLDTSAILEIDAATKGVLFPRIALESDITTPVNGLFYYSSDSIIKDFRGYINGQWSSLTRPEQLILSTGTTTLTLNESHRNKVIYTTAATGVTITGADLSIGFTCTIVKSGAGDVTFTVAGGLTYEGIDNVIYTQNLGATFIKKSATVWVGLGGVGAAGGAVITDGNATTAAGSSVNWGGNQSADVVVDGTNTYSITLQNVVTFGVSASSEASFTVSGTFQVNSDDIDLTGTSSYSVTSNNIVTLDVGGSSRRITINPTELILNASGTGTAYGKITTGSNYVTLEAVTGTTGADNQIGIGLVPTGINMSASTPGTYSSIDFNPTTFTLSMNSVNTFTMTTSATTFEGGEVTGNKDFYINYKRFTGGNNNHTNTGSLAFIWGDNNINAGAFGAAILGELSEIASGKNAFISGERNYVSAYGGVAQGRGVNVGGVYSWGGGWYSPNGLSGKTNTKAPLISGSGSFGFFETDASQTAGHGVLANSSAVLAGRNPNIPSDSPYSVILGGDGIKARAGEPSQVYVPTLNIITVPDNDNTLTQWLARDATTGKVKYVNSTTLSFNVNTAFKISTGITTPWDFSNSDSVFSISTDTPGTVSNPNIAWFQSRTTTTTSGSQVVESFAVPAGSVVYAVVYVVARRTGGTSGTGEDGAAYRMEGVFHTISGTTSAIGTPAITIIGESQAGCDAFFQVQSGLVQIKIAGTTNNNFSWHVTAKIMKITD